MPFNGTGTFTRVHDWTTDLANTVPVTASRMDAEDDGFATGLSNAICRDGQSTTTARIPFASGVSAAAGSTSAVAYAQTNDLNTGMYFPGSDQWALVAGGTTTLSSTSSALSSTVTYTVTGSDVNFVGFEAVSTEAGISHGPKLRLYRNSASPANSDFIGALDLDGNDAGGNRTTFARMVGQINDTTDASEDGQVRFQVSINGTLTDRWVADATGLNINGALIPVTTDGGALGSTSLMWSDLFLASGAIINFNNGDVTVTHSADTLTVAGGTLAASGNATVGGTLGVTGAATLSSTLGVTGAATLSSTLAVTGAVTANNSAGITGRNTVKAFGSYSGGALQSGSFNVASVVDGGTVHAVSFTTAMANSAYIVVVTKESAAAGDTVTLRYSGRTTAGFDITAINNSNGAVSDPGAYSFIVMSNE